MVAHPENGWSGHLGGSMTARGPHGRALERLAEDGDAREIAHEYPPRVAPTRSARAVGR
jgi:hypothetical protein